MIQRSKGQDERREILLAGLGRLHTVWIDRAFEGATARLIAVDNTVVRSRLRSRCTALVRYAIRNKIWHTAGELCIAQSTSGVGQNQECIQRAERVRTTLDS
jgi:hypothetical protein